MKNILRHLTWIPTLYTAEGLPYVIVMQVVVLMYGRLGLPNAEIAFYTAWLYLPWVLKPFWSPIVDLFRTKRWWILAMQALIGGSLAALALSLSAPNFVRWSLAALWIMAFSSATHDIAADGFYILALDEREQSFYVGIRSTFYRVATIAGQGLVVMMAGLLEAWLRPSVAWAWTFYFVAVLFVLIFFFHCFILPRTANDVQQRPRPAEIIPAFFEAFRAFLTKPGFLPAVLFMLLYRLPEALLVKISGLFLMAPTAQGGLEMTTAEIGLVSGTIGVIGLTLGGILGGIAAEAGGLRRWLWPMVAAITVPDVVYIILAYYQPEGIPAVGMALFFEQFGYGFGFTAYMLFLMHFARGRFATAHYAFCTGFMALGMMLPGMAAGWLQESVGYLNFFIIATALCVITVAVSFLAQGLLREKYNFK